MTLSQEVLDGIAFAENLGLDKIHLKPPAQTREMMKHAPPNPNPTPVAKVVDSVVKGPLGDIPIRIYIPAGEGPFPAISFFHGGGFVLMNIDSHDEICRQLCKGATAVVMSVDYALAPEHPFPAGPDDCTAATRWFIEHAADFSGDGARMAVAGDSAGGYMALAVAQQLAKEAITLRAQVGAYPVTDHYSSNHPSWQENKEGYILSAELMRWFWDHYTRDEQTFAAASPLRTDDLSGLCPALIMTANYDPLRDEGRAYADKLKAAGVETRYENYQNVHGFFGNGSEMGTEAMQRACAFLLKKLA